MRCAQSTYHAWAASVHWCTANWSPSAVSAADDSGVKGFERIMAAVFAHDASTSCEILSGWIIGKFGVIGVTDNCGWGTCKLLWPC